MKIHVNCSEKAGIFSYYHIHVLLSKHTMKNKSTSQQGNICPFTILQGYPIYIAGQRRKICGLLQMYAWFVAIVTNYGVKKDGLKKLVKGK